MDFLNKGSKYINTYFSKVSDDNMLGQVIAILLILLTVLMVPKLPSSVNYVIRNNYFRIFFIIIIIILAKNHLAISLLCLIIFFIINSVPIKQQILKPKSTTQCDSELKQNNILESFQEQNHRPEQTIHKFPTINLDRIIPSISIESAIDNALSDSMRSQIINSSAIPLSENITPTTASTILAVNPIADNIVLKIKENFTDYTNNTIINEEKMRTNAKSNPDKELSNELKNSANKLLIAREALASIINNHNVDVNEQLLKNLVKSDLLSEASNKALNSGDNITARQLQQVSQSHLNTSNGLIQSDVIKLKASNAHQNGLLEDSSKLSIIANDHLHASLNMINYNNHMEKALDAFYHGNYELSEQYEKEANDFLKKNVTLNDNIKGKPVVSSENLYEEVHIPGNIGVKNKCDDIPAVNTSGWDDYGHIN